MPVISSWFRRAVDPSSSPAKKAPVSASPSSQDAASLATADSEKQLQATTAAPSSIPPTIAPSPPPPDGGLVAWLQVLAAHLVVFNSWGNISSFGIFQSYYTTNLQPAPTASAISWIGSIQIFLIFFLGTFSGRLTDAGYFIPTVAAGLILQLVGVFCTSVAKTYWQLLLSQGICQGIGDGLLFCPVIALVSTYFSPRKRAVALALQACGGATGGMVFPAIAQSLLPKVGFGWTVRTMGFVMLFNAVIILVCAKPRVPPRRGGQLFELTAFKEAPYAFFAAGCFFVWWGTFWAYFYTRPYALNILGTSQYTSFSLLLLFNGIGIPGRILPATLADRYTGPINVFIPGVTIAAILVFCWIAVASLTGYWVFLCFLGFFAATLQGIFPSSLSSLTTDPQKFGIRIGMVFSIVSIACLTGPPIAGALIRADDERYLGAQVFGGCAILLGIACLTTSRVKKGGWGLKRM